MSDTVSELKQLANQSKDKNEFIGKIQNSSNALKLIDTLHTQFASQKTVMGKSYPTQGWFKTADNFFKSNVAQTSWGRSGNS